MSETRKKARELSADEALELIFKHAAEIRPFTQHDWYAWAGAGKNPRIYEGEDYTIVMAWWEWDEDDTRPRGSRIVIEVWDANPTGAIPTDQDYGRFFFEKEV